MKKTRAPDKITATIYPPTEHKVQRLKLAFLRSLITDLDIRPDTLEAAFLQRLETARLTYFEEMAKVSAKSDAVYSLLDDCLGFDLNPKLSHEGMMAPLFPKPKASGKKTTTKKAAGKKTTTKKAAGKKTTTKAAGKKTTTKTTKAAAGKKTTTKKRALTKAANESLLKIAKGDRGYKIHDRTKRTLFDRGLIEGEFTSGSRAGPQVVTQNGLEYLKKKFPGVSLAKPVTDMNGALSGSNGEVRP